MSEPNTNQSSPSAAVDPPKPKPLVLPPELQNHAQYRVIKVIGRGGMGVLYLVEHKLTSRTEALKVIHPHLASKQGVRERFLREIQNAAKLNHPNVVRTLNALAEGDLLGLVMEYAPGETLHKLVSRLGPLPVDRALDFILQAAEGLRHADEVGVVHRDIKPANLIISQQTDRLRLRILDFGLAKSNFDSPDQHQMTHVDSIVGTPEYIAPEQALKPSDADVRADIYSLGCCLYYALSGKHPFQGETTLAVLHAHLIGDYKPLNELRPELPKYVVQLQQIMMNKEREKRFQNPSALIEAIKKCLRALAAQPTTNFPQPVQTANDASVKKSTTPSVETASASKSWGSQPTVGIQGNQLKTNTASLIETIAEQKPSHHSNPVAPSGSTDPEDDHDDSQSQDELIDLVSNAASKSKSLSSTSLSKKSRRDSKSRSRAEGVSVATKKTSNSWNELKGWIRSNARMLLIGAAIVGSIVAIVAVVMLMPPSAAKRTPATATAMVYIPTLLEGIDVYINDKPILFEQESSSNRFIAKVKAGTIVISYRKDSKEIGRQQVKLKPDQEYLLMPNLPTIDPAPSLPATPPTTEQSTQPGV